MRGFQLVRLMIYSSKSSSKSSSTDLGPNAEHRQAQCPGSLPPDRRVSMKMVDATHSSLRVIETRLSVGRGPHSYSSVSAAWLAWYSLEAVLGGVAKD